MSTIRNAVRRVGVWEHLGNTCALFKVAGVTVAVCQRVRAHRSVERPWRTEILGNPHRSDAAKTLDGAKALAERAVAVDLSCILSAIDKA